MVPTLAPAQLDMVSWYCPINYTLNVTAGNIGYVFFRGNDLVDPDYAIGGAQATNQRNNQGLSNFYNKFYVKGSKFRCHIEAFAANNTDFQTCIGCCGPVFEDNTTLTDPPTMPTTISVNTVKTIIGQQPFFKQKPFWIITNTQQCKRNYVNLKQKYKSTRFMVGKKFDEQLLYGTTGASGSSPLMQWFWCIGVYNGTSFSQTFQINVSIKYWVRYFDRYPTTSTQF